MKTKEEYSQSLLRKRREKDSKVKFSVADLGCLSRIPILNFFHPGSRIRIFSIPDTKIIFPGD